MSSTEVSATDINIVAAFLANQQTEKIPDSKTGTQGNIIVICGSAIFHCFESVYEQLHSDPTAIHTLVLCGGFGHSTPYIYNAVQRCPRYAHLHAWLVNEQISEAGFIHKVLAQSGYLKELEDAGVNVLQETRSTNCGANAIEVMRVLREANTPESLPMTVVQDPTMSLRTLACFEKLFQGLPETSRPQLQSLPTFVPRVKLASGQLAFDSEHMPTENVWDMDRFLDLLLGEIPRLRDDQNGYGPNGKGFIPHVEIPARIENAWVRLTEVFEARR